MLKFIFTIYGEMLSEGTIVTFLDIQPHGHMEHVLDIAHICLKSVFPEVHASFAACFIASNGFFSVLEK